MDTGGQFTNGQIERVKAMINSRNKRKKERQMTATWKQLKEAAKGLEPNQWREFARRVSSFDPVLGAFELMHADASDWNSPPVNQWPKYAEMDCEMLENHSITTEDDAKKFWETMYS